MTRSVAAPHPLRSAVAAPLGALGQVLMCGVLLVGLPISPLTSWIISGNFAYMRDYVGTIRRSARMLAAIWDSRVMARNFTRMLEGGPARHRIEGSCTHCGQCCIDKTCVFLDMSPGPNGEARSACSIYGNWFFRTWLTCDEYPINAEDIEVYACPSFRAVPVQGLEGRRVIPIQRR
jgi:hypothetical protein